MRDRWIRLLILGLFVAVVVTPLLLLHQGGPGYGVTARSPTLIIMTPNDEQIRYEFGRAFNQWRIEQGLPTVDIQWRALGGTSDLRKIVFSQFTAAAKAGREDQGIGVDLFFGGGPFEHQRLADGITLQRDGKTIRIPLSIPPTLPAGLLAKAFPRATVGSSRLYEKDHRWIGAALSRFGIVYNRDTLRMLKLPEPTTWADLADRRYRGWVALADPAHSGSIAATYDLIVQRLGWNQGWRTLRRIFANSRYFTAGAGRVPVDVSSGEAAAGMCIDFYGRFQAGAMPDQRVGYVDPLGLNVTGADPISLLRGAPHRKVAEQFITWLLSPEAQELWQKRVGTPGGPQRFELRRLPVRRDVYTSAQKRYWTDPQVAPFKTAVALPRGVPDYYPMIAPLAHAMAIDVHQELVAAWAAILRTPDNDPRKAKMVALFDAMPVELRVDWPDRELATHWLAILADGDAPRHAEAARVLSDFSQRLAKRYYGHANSDRLMRDRIRWAAFFREHYEQVARMTR